MLKNRVIYVLDTSYSMNSLRKPALNVFNTILKANADENEKARQRTEISVAEFDDPGSFHYVYKNVNSKKAKPLALSQYETDGGSTALYDAVGEAINDALEGPDADDDETSFVLIVVTDGGENASVTYPRHRAEKLAQLIKKVQRSDRWTITFQVPKGHKESLSSLGLNAGNIREWDTDERGIREVAVSTSKGLATYYDSRSRGLKSVNNFYVETDLSKLSQRTLKRELNDLSDDYGIFSASSETQIRDFVESKTKRPYQKGQAFYQLVKSETIQSNKEILIFDKGTTAIYGGDEARELVGIPYGVSGKVKPGDLNNYEIFIQSTSYNRLLKPGQKVAIKI